MPEVNILITSVSAKVLLVNSFKEALKKEGVAGNIIGIDYNKNSPALYFCNDYRLCPLTDDEKYENFIKSLCEEFRISLIIPSSDRDVLFFSRKRHSFGTTKVMAASFEVVGTCYDKFRFYEFLKSHDFPRIKTWNEIPGTPLSFPCVVKPARGAASIGFKVIQNSAELKDSLASEDGLIIQELVDGLEYSIDYFSDFDGNTISVVPRIRMKIQSGESKVGKTVFNEEIIQQTSLLGQKLGLIGHNVVQCFLMKDGSIKFIEVNPRFGGASNLSIIAGRDTPRYLIKLLLDRHITIDSFKENLLMLRYSVDYFTEDD